jgi:transglutaminase-like putative cysteine protease
MTALPPGRFLASTPHLDWTTPSVQALAKQLGAEDSNDARIAQRCFLWVRDQIRHTEDFGLSQVTCAASEVLQHRTGFCYAKSHLLAALLRANGIPAALCYQRLAIDPSATCFCLHGFNAVFLKQHGWYRIDARGNKPGLSTDFCPPLERLAFQPHLAGEGDVPGLFPDPLPSVISVLEGCDHALQVAENLPDLSLPAA